MKMTNLKKVLSLLLCVVLIAAMALFAIGCNDNTTSSADSSYSEPSATVTELGNGRTEITFTVTDKEGKETVFSIKTDKTTVGDALLEHNLIAGDESEFGLYVKTVNGLTLDYDTDGYYWSFYINGAYASSGVDSTDVTAGASYAFKAEKA